jgi:glycosyltransferase involved in cell wall biosynthesis
MRVAFLVSGRPGTLSGGNAYNRHMIAAMRATGLEVSVHDLADGPVAALLQAMPTDAVPVIDSLALPAFADVMDVLAARRCVGLIHHPMACETEIGDDERARLRDDECARLRDIAARLLPALPRVIATSDSTATRLATEFGVDPAHIVVVPAGAEARPRSIGSGGPGCEILSVGLLISRKGHDLLMRALARLFDLDWHLTIAGEARDAAYADSALLLPAR